MKQTITCLVRNRPGVLARVTGAFAARSVNIHSLAVSQTEESEVSRMTIVVEAEEKEVDAVEEIARKLEDVLAIEDLAGDQLLARELLLLKVRADAANIPKIMQTAELFRAEVIALGETSLTLALASDAGRIDSLVRALRPMGILELSRSGRIAVSNAG
jgi:acetolactate synthase-1/3 small subunit